jgi:hypothetical protein
MSRLRYRDQPVNAVYCENHTEHTDTVRTSQESYRDSVTETNRLMLFGETVAVYCDNHTELTDTVCVGRMQSLSILKLMVHILTTGLQRARIIFAYRS